MDQIIEWLGVEAANQIQSNCMVELCVWLLEGFVKGDIWSWHVEVLKSEVEEF